MANEASIINNPTSTPAAVSTGYQRQNTRAEAGTNGIDNSYVESGPADNQVSLNIGGPVDYNGVLYAIASAVVFTLTTIGDYYIYLEGNEADENLTPTISTDEGTYDATKNGIYNSSDQRILNWRINYDGEFATAYKLFDPSQDIIYIRKAIIDILEIGVINMYAIGNVELKELISIASGALELSAEFNILRPCHCYFLGNQSSGCPGTSVLTIPYSSNTNSYNNLILPGTYKIGANSDASKTFYLYRQRESADYGLEFEVYAEGIGNAGFFTTAGDSLKLKCTYAEGLGILDADDIIS